MYRAICSKVLVLCVLGEIVQVTCGGERRAHRGEKGFSGTFADARLPQVYRAICGKLFVLCELYEMNRFTCEGGLDGAPRRECVLGNIGGWCRVDRPERYLWSIPEAGRLLQVIGGTL